MSQNEPEFKATSWHMLPPCNNVITIDITCRPAKFQDLMLCPEYNAVMVLSEAECNYLEEFNAECEPLVRALHQAQAERQQVYADNPEPGVTPRARKQRADRAVDTAKADLDTKLKQLVKAGGASESYWYELHALHGDKRVIFAPGTIVSPTRSRNFYFLTEDTPDATHAFKTLKQPDGRIDPVKFNEAFKQTSARIKAEWELVDKETTQVSTQVLASAASPVVVALLNDQLDALDEKIAEWNEAMHWRTRQYQGDKDAALESLKADPFTFEDFGRAQALCEDIWGRRHPMARVQYKAVQGEEGKADRQRLIEAVSDETLPPPQWDASADANLMRFTRGVTLGSEIDLTKGLVSAEVKAEMDFALAEGKLRGAVYYPHKDGFNARPLIPVRTKTETWKIFDRCLPENVHFEFDREFLDVRAIEEIAHTFAHWDLLKATLDNRYQLMLVGHTDKVGSNDYNQALSLRRAQVVYGLLSRNTTPWVRMFELGHWGERERDYMLAHSEAKRHHSPAELIQQYFDACDRTFRYRDGARRLPHLTDQSFALTYLIPRGELDTLIDTEDPERLNRRVEFVVLELVDSEETETKARLELGHLRAKLEGHVGGYAGVNVGLSAKLNVDVSGGVLSMGNQADLDRAKQEKERRAKSPFPIPEASGEGGAEAFIGARVEAGLRASLDWKAPENETANTQSQTSESTPEFKALGTAGYIVSGQAGASLTGKIKIGFDDEILRFVVKLEASLCLGLGAGGKMEFVVDARQVWDFITLVHEQLLTADFNWLDFFEEGVYDQFVAWSYELMKTGLLYQGAALRLGIEHANQAVQILQKIQELGSDFNRYETDSASLHDLIDKLAEPEYAAQAKYAPPEVKGRILFRLMYSSRHVWRDWDLTLKGVDVDGRRERAVRYLLQHGVSSKREYREVLEHTTSRSESNRTAAERCRWASHVQQKLIEYLNDSEDRQALKAWWNRLPDASGCTCSGADLDISPFE